MRISGSRIQGSWLEFLSAWRAVGDAKENGGNKAFVQPHRAFMSARLSAEFVGRPCQGHSRHIQTAWKKPLYLTTNPKP